MDDDNRRAEPVGPGATTTLHVGARALVFVGALDAREAAAYALGLAVPEGLQIQPVGAEPLPAPELLTTAERDALRAVAGRFAPAEPPPVPPPPPPVVMTGRGRFPSADPAPAGGADAASSDRPAE